MSLTAVNHSALLELALTNARVGLGEAGIPIGAALFGLNSRLLGRGHNRRVQGDDRPCTPRRAAFPAAGRRRDYRTRSLPRPALVSGSSASANSTAAKGWENLCRQAPGNTALPGNRCGPIPLLLRQHQLKGTLAFAEHDGKRLAWWQIRITGGGRIWYLLEAHRRTVWITEAGTGHQREQTTSGEKVTQAQESDLIEKNYTHGPVDLTLIVNLANRQATLKAKVFGEVTATATVQEGRPIDKIISDKFPEDVVTLRLEAHKVKITGTLKGQPVAHEVELPRGCHSH